MSRAAKQIRYRQHATNRMLDRNIRPPEVEHVILTGQVIEEHLNDADQPHPRRLLFAWVGGRPIHVLIVENDADQLITVETVYEPGERWDTTFTRRR
jgi:hypothetical protein